MPCTFFKGQKVKGLGSEKHTITAIKRVPRSIPAGWGNTIVEDVFIQVDNQKHGNGELVWYGWGNFKALSE